MWRYSELSPTPSRRAASFLSGQRRQHALDVLLLETPHRFAEFVHRGSDRPCAGRGRAADRRRQQRAVAEDDGALQGVVQLADVALPRARQQDLHRLVGDAADALAQRPGMRGEQMDSTRSGMSSRRSRNGGSAMRHHVQPIIQILAESARLDLAWPGSCSSRPGCGRCDGDRLVGADRQHLLLLDGAQQLGLRRQRQLGDLVEKHRARSRMDEHAGLVAVGAGEGALAMAEELVLQQIVRNGGAVDGEEAARRRSRRGDGWRGRALPCRCRFRRRAAPSMASAPPCGRCAALRCIAGLWPTMKSASASRGSARGAATGCRAQRRGIPAAGESWRAPRRAGSASSGNRGRRAGRRRRRSRPCRRR